MTETKRCRGCDEDRPVEEFRWVRKAGHNPYRQSRCRGCERKTDYDHGAAVAEARGRCSDTELLRWPSTAAEARALGVNKFFNGVPCEPKGHIGLRRAKNSNCVQCDVEGNKRIARRKTLEAQQQREAKRQEAWGGNCPWPATRREAQRIGSEFYFTGVACEEGHIPIRETASHHCTNCPTAADRKRQRMVEEGTEEVLAEDAARAKEKYWRNPEKQRQRIARRRERGLVSSIYANELSIHDLRRPPWQTAEEEATIKAFYDDCPPDHTVDHDVPFVHPVLAGLHVLANLQYAGPHRNPRKGNRVSYTQAEAEAEVARGRAVWRDDTDGGHVLDWEKYRGVHPVFPK